jgi:hypothetical protein
MSLGGVHSRGGQILLLDLDFDFVLSKSQPHLPPFFCFPNLKALSTYCVVDFTFGFEIKLYVCHMCL